MKKTVMIAALFLALCCFSCCLADGYSTEPVSPLWHTYDPSLHWYYSQLNAKEKQAFSSRYDAFAAGDVTLFDISGFGLSEQETERVELAISLDCPELMICSVTGSVAKFFGTIEDPEWFEEYRTELSADLDACLQEISRLRLTAEWGTTDLSRQQAYDLHIARNTQYLLDNDGPEGTIHLDSEVRSAKSALVNRTAVCEGFSNSTQLAMRCSGIPCIYVRGTTTDGRGHAWNMIRINGTWYHYDATWNSNGAYINLSDDEIRRTRSVSEIFEENGFTLPVCSSSFR